MTVPGGRRDAVFPLGRRDAIVPSGQRSAAPEPADAPARTTEGVTGA
ncbi:hypothetical protein [Streptomyces collinus]